MNLKDFKIISEAEDSYHLEGPNGKKFTFEKNKLNEKARKLVESLKSCEPTQMAEGGELIGGDTGATPDFKRAATIEEITTPITPEMTEEMVQNVGLPASTVEKKAVEKAIPLVREGAQGFMSMADDILNLSSKEIDKFAPAQQEAILKLKDQAYKAAVDYLSPETIAKLEKLDPEIIFSKIYSLPEIKNFRHSFHKYKNLVNQGLNISPDNAALKKMKFAEGGEVDPIIGSSIENTSIQPSILPINSIETISQNQKNAYDSIGNAAKNLANEEAFAINNMKSKVDSLPTQQDIINQYQKKDDELLNSYRNSNIEPGRLYSNMSTGNKVLSAIGMLLSGAGAGITGQENMAAKVVDDAINRDIESQKNAKEGKYNLWKMNRDRLGDELQANLATKNQLYTDVKWQLEKAASKFKGTQAAAQAQLASSMIDKELAQNRMMLSLLSPNQENSGGAEAGTEQAFSNQLGALQQLAPKLAEEKTKKYLPGIGITKINPTDKDRSDLAGISALKAALTDLQATATQGMTLPKTEADEINKSKMMALMPQFRTAYGLGVLSEGDKKLLEDLIVDPGMLRTSVAIKKLQALKDNSDFTVKSIYDKLGVTPFKQLNSNQNAEALQWIQQNPNDPRVPAIKQKLGIK